MYANRTFTIAVVTALCRCLSGVLACGAILVASISVANAGPAISLSRTQVDFGRLRPQMESSVQPVFVTNIGNAPLTLQALTIAGTDAAQFAVAGTCSVPMALVPGARCRVDLTANIGYGQATRAATLSIVSDASPPATPVQLRATMDNADAYLRPVDPDPDWIDFPPQAVGSAPTSATIRINNVTGLSFTITSMGLAGGDTGDFAVSSPCQAGGTFAAGTQCVFVITFAPTANGPRSTELRLVLTVYGINGLSAYSITGVGGDAGGISPTAVNYQGLWYAAPAESESGWGINFAHQAETIFATWFTYDPNGKAWWLSMTADKTAERTYTGTLIQTGGPAFNAVPFDPTRVTRTPVGTGTLTFGDGNTGSFAYVVNGVAQTKSITRQAFGPLPTCTYGASPSFAQATNYQDLWWVAAGAEGGWGVNLTHQGDNIFATWFTYDLDGAPLWLSVTASKTGPNVYGGPLIRTGGPAFSAVPFNPALVTRTVVGDATFTFANGSVATFAYTVNGVAQTKAITRQLFAPPAGTLCQ